MLIWRTKNGGPLPEVQITFNTVVDPEEAERNRAMMEAHRLNSDWL